MSKQLYPAEEPIKMTSMELWTLWHRLRAIGIEATLVRVGNSPWNGQQQLAYCDSRKKQHIELWISPNRKVVPNE